MHLPYVEVKTVRQWNRIQKLQIGALDDIVALAFQLLDENERTPCMDDPCAPQESIYVKNLFYACKHALRGVHINLDKLCQDKMCRRGGVYPNEWIHVFRLVEEPIDFTASPPRSVRVLAPLPKRHAIPMECRMF